MTHSREPFFCSNDETNMIVCVDPFPDVWAAADSTLASAFYTHHNKNTYIMNTHIHIFIYIYIYIYTHTFTHTKTQKHTAKTLLCSATD